MPVDIQQLLGLVTRARELIKEPEALQLINQIQAQIQQYAQDRSALADQRSTSPERVSHCRSREGI